MVGKKISKNAGSDGLALAQSQESHASFVGPQGGAPQMNPNENTFKKKNSRRKSGAQVAPLSMLILLSVHHAPKRKGAVAV